MKFSKSFAWLFFLAASFVQSRTFAQNRMIFSGHLDNMPNLSAARLRFNSDSVQLISDSVAIIDGSFTFEGTVSSPVLADLIIEIRQPDVDFAEAFYERFVYLQPGKISLKSADSLKTVRIEGSALNNDFIRFQSTIRPASEKIAALKAEFYNTSGEIRQTDTFQQRMGQENTRLEEDFRRLQLKFVSAHPRSLVSLDALVSYAGEIPDPDKIGPLFDKLSARLKNSPQGKKLAAELEKMKTTAVGSKK